MTENFITIIIGYLLILVILVLKFRYKKFKLNNIRPKEIIISKSALLYSVLPFLVVIINPLTELSIIILLLLTLIAFKLTNQWKT